MLVSSLSAQPDSTQMAAWINHLFEHTDTDLPEADSLFQRAWPHRDLHPWSLPRLEFVRSDFFYHSGEPDSAMVWGERALDGLLNEGNVDWALATYNTLGAIQTHHGAFTEAIEWYLQGLKLSEQEGRERNSDITRSNIGWTHFQNENFAEAERYTQEALANQRVRQDSMGIAQSLNNLGSIVATQGDAAAGLEYFKESLALREALGMEYEIPWGYNNIGGCYLMLGNLREAEINLSKAAQAFEAIGNHSGQASAWSNLGLIFQDEQDFPTAEIYFLRSLDIAQRHQLRDQESIAQLNLTDLYEQFGQSDKALFHLRALKALDDSLRNESNTRIIQEMQTQYETAQKDAQLADERAARAESDEALARQRLLNFGIGAALVVLFIVGVMLWNQQRQRTARKLAQAEAESERQLRQERERGAREILSATERERQRIARDLHDGVGQQLTGIRMAVESGQKPEEVLSALETTASDVRQLSHQMMPKALSSLGLIPALEDMLEATFRGSTTTSSLEYFNILDDRDLDVDIALYRIAQELAQNCLKHAGAQSFELQLIGRKSHFVLIATDDGRGFASAQNPSGIGLSNILHRIQLLGGEMNVESEPGKGSSFTLRIPQA